MKREGAMENEKIKCISCGKIRRPCCGDDKEGYTCKKCCNHSKIRIWEGKVVAGGTYERGGCET